MNPNKKKRICFVRHSYFPDDARDRKQANSLTNAGYLVDIICLRKKGQSSCETVNGVNVYRIPLSHKRASVLRYLAEYTISFVMMFITLSCLYLYRRYNCIQICTMPDFLVFTACIPKIFGAKVLLDLHEPTPELWITKYGLNRMRFLLKLQTKIEQVAVQFADHSLAVTETLRRNLGERGIDVSGITVINNACEEETFYYDSNAPKHDFGKKFTLITHGLIEQRYGHELVIRAVHKLQHKLPNLHFEILGDGEYRQELTKLVEELQCENLVNFSGFVSRDQLLQRIRGADVGIVTMYRSPYSELIDTNKMYEYMALRKPVLISRLPGVEENFDDSCVKFFEPGSVEDLSAAIEEVYQNNDLLNSFITKASARYEKLRWDVTKERYVRVFHELCNINPQIYDNKIESALKSNLIKFYYFLKPAMPRSFQLKVRKVLAKKIRKTHFNDWPINFNSNTPPENWTGWPEKKKFSVVLRHDVESIYGMQNIDKLIELEKDLGFRSLFNFSPERYDVSETLITEIKKKGFEVGLHGLNHDGKLYSSKKEFQKRAIRINKYLKDWNISGFASPSTHHNFEWISELNILYDSSSYDTDPFEPKPDPVKTIFPFIYTSKETGRKYVELPYTLPQDFTLYVILGEEDNQLWKNKIDWIVENNGMLLLNIHPDYMFFDDDQKKKNRYSFLFYKETLEYINTKYHGQFIHLLPCEIAEYWMKR